MLYKRGMWAGGEVRLWLAERGWAGDLSAFELRLVESAGATLVGFGF